MSKSKRIKQNIGCTYDFISRDDNSVVLSKDGKIDKTNVIFINFLFGDENEEFRKMGEYGKLRGKAKILYSKGINLFPCTITYIIKRPKEKVEVFYNF